MKPAVSCATLLLVTPGVSTVLQQILQQFEAIQDPRPSVTSNTLTYAVALPPASKCGRPSNTFTSEHASACVFQDQGIELLALILQAA